MSSKPTRALRMAVMAAVAAVVIIGAVLNAGTGSFSSFGLSSIAAICPLGYLETALAGRDAMPRLLIPFLLIVAVTILLGRVFCAWICPVPLARKLLKNELDEGRKAGNHNPADGGRHEQEKTAGAYSKVQANPEKNSSSGLLILGATLGSSAVFGFPIFCLICPIGLIFATVFALLRLIQFNEPTVDLIAFPVIIIIEIVLLKKWCSKLCPIGALLSLFSRFNRSLIPTVDPARCLEETSGEKCQRCRLACSFDIDLKQGSGTGHISDCTKCRECADNCPVQAIRFPWR